MPEGDRWAWSPANKAIWSVRLVEMRENGLEVWREFCPYQRYWVWLWSFCLSFWYPSSVPDFGTSVTQLLHAKPTAQSFSLWTPLCPNWMRFLIVLGWLLLAWKACQCHRWCSTNLYMSSSPLFLPVFHPYLASRVPFQGFTTSHFSWLVIQLFLQ